MSCFRPKNKEPGVKMRPLHIFYVCIGIFCGLVSVGLGLFCFVYPDWIRYSVNSTSTARPKVVNEDIINYSRMRGIFFQTLLNKDDYFKPLVDEKTYQVKLDQANPADEAGKYILDLRKAHMGTFLCGFILATFALLIAFGSLVQHCRSGSGSHLLSKPISIFAGLVFLFGVLCYFASYIIFHILMIEERILSPASVKLLVYSTWPTNIQAVTTIAYSYNYYVGWGAIVLLIISAVIFLTMNACCGARKTRTEQPQSFFLDNRTPPNERRTIPPQQSNGGGGYGNSSPPTVKRYDHDVHSINSVGAHRLPRHNVDTSMENPSYQPPVGDLNGSRQSLHSPTRGSNVYRIY